MKILSSRFFTRTRFCLQTNCSRNRRVFVFNNPHKITLRCLSTNTDIVRHLKIKTDNIFASVIPDVKGYENLYLHDVIWENIHKWPNKTALVCSVTGRSYTYSQVKKLSDRLATSLRKLNIMPRDTVAIILPNIPEYAIITLGASAAGVRITLINPEYNAEYMNKQLSNAEATLIFTVPSKYDVVKNSIGKDMNVKIPIIVVNDGSGSIPEGTIKLEDLMRDGIEEWKDGNTSIDYNDVILLPYSSGTTGLPKGVQLSHRNVVVNLFQVTADEINVIREATETQEVLPIILPLYHIYGLIVSMMTHLRYGSKLIFVPRFSMTEMIKTLEIYRPTVLHLVPPIVEMIIQNEQIKPHHLRSVKYVMSGAAPLQEKTIALFKEHVGDSVILFQGWGMTEASPVVTYGSHAPSDSVGVIIPNTEVRIVGYDENDQGHNLKIGETGEIYIRGPQVMKGYFKNPEATKHTMDGDWMKTGDLGFFSEEGIMYIKGRLKELIKVQGFQVAPAELEDIIRTCNKVKDVAVIGIPHEKYGEIPKAFIVPKDDVRVKPDDIKEFVAERVIKYKRLGDVKFVDSIPKSATGKILRNLVKQL